MNIIVSADQHIKVSRELPLNWQLNRFRELWSTYVNLCQQHKAKLVLAGDMFHNAKPNLHEVQLFLELLHLLEQRKVETHIIAGNHENLGTDGTTLQFFQPTFDGLQFVEYHHRYDMQIEGNFELAFVGHNQLNDWLQRIQPVTKRHRLVFSHFRPTVNQHIQEEIDVARFCSTADLIIAGDIHTDFESGNLVYANAPLNCHFESAPKCGCLLVTCNTKKAAWSRIPLALPNLIQVEATAESYREVDDSYNFYRYVVSGSAAELRKLKAESPNSKLLKVPEVEEVYADLEVKDEIKNQSLEEALIGYMQELQFSDEKIKSMMEVYCEL